MAPAKAFTTHTRMAAALALACLLAAAAGALGPAWGSGTATSGVSGGVAWSFDEETGELTVAPAAEDECKSGYDPGEMYDCAAASSAPWYSWRESITSLVVEEGVTNIGDYSFGSLYAKYSYSSLESVSLPSTLTDIGKTAFGRSGLTSLSIPEGVESIGTYSFAYCTSLQSLDLPSSLTDIGTHAFAGCSALGSVALAEGTETVPNGIFSGCSSLASVSLPSTLTAIEAEAFGSCTSLVSITIPAGVTSVGYKAFRNCTSLQSVEFEGLDDGTSALSSIGAGAFYGCSALSSVRVGLTTSFYANQADEGDDSFPDGTEVVFVVPDVGEGVAVCSGESGDLAWAYYASLEVDGELLERVLVFSGEGAMGAYTASSLPVWAAWAGDAAVLRVVVGDGATSVGAYAFYCMADVEGYALPEGVEGIGKYAFAGAEGSLCANITSLSFLPGTVEEIGAYAFAYTGLASLDGVPAAVATVGDGAFEGCSGLASAAFPQGSALSGLGDGAFAGAGEGLAVDLGACTGLTKASQLGDAVFEGDDVGVLVLPEALRSLDLGLLDGAASVGELVLPATLAAVEGSFAELDCVEAYTVRYGKLTAASDDAEELAAALAAGVDEALAPSQAYDYGGLASTGDLDACAGLTTVTMDFEGGADEEPSVAYLADAGGEVEYVGEGALSYDEGEGAWRLSVPAGATGAYAALVAKPSVADAEVAVEAEAYVYDGTAKEPAVSVAYGDTTLAQGDDYAVSYGDNVDAGTATVTVTGAGGYTGSVTATFEIAQAPIEGAEVAVADQAYTGAAVEPGVAVTLGGVELSEGADYTVEYADNVEVGTATVTVEGVGNYTGTATATFEIAEAEEGSGGGGGSDGGSDGDSDGGEDSDADGGSTDDGSTSGDTAGSGSDDEAAGGDADDAASYSFEDVQDASAYYYAPVYAVAEAGYMTGEGDGTSFGVGRSLNRQAMVVVLYRIFASDEEQAEYGSTSDSEGYADNATPLTDVKDAKYYTAAVNWAYATGVATGYSTGEFGVGDGCSFQQFCTFVARALGSDGELTDAEAKAALASFADGSKVAAYADNSVAYLCSVVYDDEGSTIVGGTAAGRLNPASSVSRERTATVVYRCMAAGLF